MPNLKNLPHKVIASEEMLCTETIVNLALIDPPYRQAVYFRR